MAYDKSNQIKKTLEFKDKELQRIAIKYINDIFKKNSVNTARLYSNKFISNFKNLIVTNNFIDEIKKNSKFDNITINQIKYISVNTQISFKGKKFFTDSHMIGIDAVNYKKEIAEYDNLDDILINPPKMKNSFCRNKFYAYCDAKIIDKRFCEAFKRWGNKINSNITIDYKKNQDLYNNLSIEDLVQKKGTIGKLSYKNHIELLYVCSELNYPEVQDYKDFFERSPLLVNQIINKNNTGNLKYDKFIKNNIKNLYELEMKYKAVYLDLEGLSEETKRLIINYFSNYSHMNNVSQTAKILKKYILDNKINAIDDFCENDFFNLFESIKQPIQRNRIINFFITIIENQNSNISEKNFNKMRSEILYKMRYWVSGLDYDIRYINSNEDIPCSDVVFLVNINNNGCNSKLSHNVQILDFRKIKNIKIKEILKKYYLKENICFSRLDTIFYNSVTFFNYYFSEIKENVEITEEMVMNYINKSSSIKSGFNAYYDIKELIRIVNKEHGISKEVCIYKPKTINRKHLPSNISDNLYTLSNYKNLLDYSKESSLKAKIIKILSNIIVITGFRLGSLLNMKISDIDFENNKIRKVDKCHINDNLWIKIDSSVMSLFGEIVKITRDLRNKNTNSIYNEYLFVNCYHNKLNKISGNSVKDFLRKYKTNSTQLRKISIRLQNDAANELGINPKLLMLARDHSPTSTVEYEVYDGFTDENIKTFGIVGDTTPNGDDVLDARDFRASVDVLTECESCENFCYRKEERERIETKLRYYREVFETSDDETIKRYAGYAVEKLEKHLESVS